MLIESGNPPLTHRGEERCRGLWNRNEFEERCELSKSFQITFIAIASAIN
jgi:hypothetical protein